MVGVYVSAGLPQESQGEDKTKTPLPLKCWLGLWADVSALAGDLTWSSDFRRVHELCLGVGNATFPQPRGAGMFKLAVLRCAPASFASGCCSCWVYFLPFRCC